MEHELTPTQARAIAALRLRHPGAEVVAHQKPWGVLVEVRRGRRTVELARFDWSGLALPEQRLDLAA